MDVYAHEKEQIEGIKSWWRENRWYIITGLAISVAIVGGWRFWQSWQQERAEMASQIYGELQTKASLKDSAALEAAVHELQSDYSGTPYAALGSMTLAAAEVESGNFNAAAESLRWAMENSDDPELAMVARLRLARVLLQLDQPVQARDVLDAGEAGKFAGLYGEVRGDAFLAEGNRDAARTAYEAALAAMDENNGAERQVVQMKLDNLAMPLPSAEPVAGTASSESTEEDAAADGEDK